MTDDGRHPAIAWRRALLLLHDDDQPGNGLAPTTRLVGVAMAEHVDRQSGELFAGPKALTKRTGLSERSVRQHVGLLVKAGFLKLEVQGGVPGGPRTSRYRVTIPASPAGVTASTPEPRAGVTHAPSAGITETTPADGSTTPANDAPTPASPAPEQEEPVEPAGRACGLADLVRFNAGEVPARLQGLAATHGQHDVDRAIADLVDEGALFGQPSELIKAVAAKIAEGESFDLADYASGRAVPPPPRPTWETHEDEQGRLISTPAEVAAGRRTLQRWSRDWERDEGTG